MDELNAVPTQEVNDAQAVNVEPQESGVNDGEIQQQETVAQEPAKPVQTPEQNAVFAAMRRKAEAEKQAALSQSKQQYDPLLQALNQYGFQGTPQEIADMLLSQKTQIPVEQIRAEREKAFEQAKQEYIQSPEYIQQQVQLEMYRTKDRDRRFADDLADIKKSFPDCKASSVLDLGPEFLSLMSNKDYPVSAVVAYKAVMESKKPIPPTIGAVNTATPIEKDYYTPDEVDKLTKKDLDNPKVYENVKKSMHIWK